MNFEDAFTKLLDPTHEGGYTNRLDDPGGETMYGITFFTARRNGYLGPMRNLPRELAKTIARREYWDAVNAEQLPDALRFDVFDGAYNSGPRQSVKWLQQAVYVDVDGVFGPHTLMGVQTYKPESICARYNGYRQLFLADLPTWPSFGKGWARRLAANLIGMKG